MKAIERTHALPCAAEMSRYDQACIAAGTPALELMQRAAQAVFLELQRSFGLLQGQQRKILILAGPGNNGGDGVALARLLRDFGQDAAVLLAGSARYSAELQQQLARYQGPLFVLGTREAIAADCQVREEGLEPFLAESQLVIDALLGTGQRGAARGSVAEVLRLAQEKVSATAPWVAIDVPTGVDADTGQVFELHCQAKLLLAIQFCKRGLYQYPARATFAQLRCLDIGIQAQGQCEFSTLPETLLPARKPQAHKGDFGRVLVVGGSSRYLGAPVLASRAALRAGTGLVTRVALKGQSQPFTSAEEIILCPLPGAELGPRHATALYAELRAANVLLLGPGLGRGAPAQRLAQMLIERALDAALPLVVDADGLVALAQIAKKKKFRQRWSPARKGKSASAKRSPLLITPHPGEAANLLGVSSAQVQADRYAAAKALAERYAATVLLKGAGSIVYAGDGSGAWVQDYANPFLATAGSGDVLAGILASLLGQGMPEASAACAALRLHSLAADIATRAGTRPIIASDLIDALPQAISSQSRGK